MARILLVEDDPGQREYMVAVLEGAGHVVTAAEDGEEGLAVAVAEEPDLVIADVVMPGLDGIQLIEALRAQAGLPQIPVLLVTALSEREQMRTGMAAGADDYITKPCAPQELLAAADAALRKRELREAKVVRLAEHQTAVALHAQREKLADAYEQQLRMEVSARWEDSQDPSFNQRWPDAVIMVVRMFAQWPPATVARASPAAIRKVYEQVSDTFYLFHAARVLFHGTQAIAAFTDVVADDAPPPSAASRASRAAESLRTSAPDLPLVAHVGEIEVLRISDPIHGGDPLALPVGEGLAQALAAMETARRAGWQMACTSAYAARLAGEVPAGAAVPEGDPLRVQSWRPGAVPDAQDDALQVHDRGEFARRYGATPQLGEAVWRVFASHGPKLVHELGQAVATRNRAEARRLAHSLKANAGMISAGRMRDAAARLEEAAPASPEEDLDTMMRAVADSFAEFARVEPASS